MNHAFQYGVKPVLGLNATLIDNQANLDIIRCTGEYTMTLGSMDQHGRSDLSVSWKYESRNTLKIGVSTLFTAAIKTFLKKYEWYGTLMITGWTKASIPCNLDGTRKSVSFHANEFVLGRAWYDWCMVPFLEDNMDPEDAACPAKIYGFFKFTTPGTPTPYLVEDQRYSPQHIRHENMEDDTLYAVVHSASDYLPMYEIENEFISPFKLGSVKKCLYIVDAWSILGPLSVFPDVGGDGKKYFAEIPKRKWGRYFGDLVKVTGDNSSDSQSDNDEEHEDESEEGMEC